jgi:hypothetical protein
MTLGDFMDVLGRLHKLTPAQRRAVAEVLAEPEEVSEPVAASEPVAKPARLTRHSQPFSDYEREMVSKYAALYSRATTRQRQKIYREAAATLGRSLESVKKVIRIARKESEAKKGAAQ